MRISVKHEQAPAFQFYPQEWVASNSRVKWNLETQGAYILLLCYCWTGDGRLPLDMEVLARMCNCRTQKMEKMWEELKDAFVIADDGTFMSQEIENERKIQADHREERSKAGKKGAEARWKK